VHRHNARLPGSGQSAVGGTGAGLSDHRATCVTAESWCGRAVGIDGPTWVMATYKIADCTRYIPYPKTSAMWCMCVIERLAEQARLGSWVLLRPIPRPQCTPTRHIVCTDPHRVQCVHSGGGYTMAVSFDQGCNHATNEPHIHHQQCNLMPAKAAS
jgi:hypothetical protein